MPLQPTSMAPIEIQGKASQFGIVLLTATVRSRTPGVNCRWRSVYLIHEERNGVNASQRHEHVTLSRGHVNNRMPIAALLRWRALLTSAHAVHNVREKSIHVLADCHSGDNLHERP